MNYLGGFIENLSIFQASICGKRISKENIRTPWSQRVKKKKKIEDTVHRPGKINILEEVKMKCLIKTFAITIK